MVDLEHYKKILPEDAFVAQPEIPIFHAPDSDLMTSIREGVSRRSLLEQKKYSEAIDLYKKNPNKNKGYYSFILQDLQYLRPEYGQEDYEALEKAILEVDRVKNDGVLSDETFKQIATSYFSFSKEENLDKKQSLFFKNRAIEVQKNLIKSKSNEDIELIQDYFTLGEYQLTFRG